MLPIGYAIHAAEIALSFIPCEVEVSHIDAAPSLALVESALRRWVNQCQQEQGGVTPRPDANLVIEALDMAYQQRGRPQSALFHSDQVSQCVAEASVSDCGVVASNRARVDAELPRQCADGRLFRSLKIEYQQWAT